MSDRLTALVLLGVCAVFAAQTLVIRRPPFAAFEAFGAETFPRGVIAVLALFSAVLLVRGRGRLLRAVDRARLRSWLETYRVPAVTLGLFAAYAWAIPLVGWLAATAAFLVALQLVLLPRRGAALAAVALGSLVFAVALAQGFERFLHVVLPRGTLF